MNKIANTYKADEGLCLLKRLTNGQYMNLTDLDFEDDRNSNNDFYDVLSDSDYILMIDVLPGKTIYVPVELESLIPYAPSVKKLKKISIADVIIAKLMYENTSIRFSLEEINGKNAKLKMWLRIAKDNNTRYETQKETVFDGFYEEI